VGSERFHHLSYQSK